MFGGKRTRRSRSRKGKGASRSRRHRRSSASSSRGRSASASAAASAVASANAKAATSSASTTGGGVEGEEGAVEDDDGADAVTVHFCDSFIDAERGRDGMHGGALALQQGGDRSVHGFLGKQLRQTKLTCAV